VNASFFYASLKSIMALNLGCANMARSAIAIQQRAFRVPLIAPGRWQSHRIATLSPDGSPACERT